jgi:hypothetical protein
VGVITPHRTHLTITKPRKGRPRPDPGCSATDDDEKLVFRVTIAMNRQSPTRTRAQNFRKLPITCSAGVKHVWEELKQVISDTWYNMLWTVSHNIACYSRYYQLIAIRRHAVMYSITMNKTHYILPTFLVTLCEMRTRSKSLFFRFFRTNLPTINQLQVI